MVYTNCSDKMAHANSADLNQSSVISVNTLSFYKVQAGAIQIPTYPFSHSGDHFTSCSPLTFWSSRSTLMRLFLSVVTSLQLTFVSWEAVLIMIRPSCSKLTTLLVNVSLKLWPLNMAYTLIFLLKKCEFFSKNICELGIVLTRTVKILTTNELVKLTMLWTTGPWCFTSLSTIFRLSQDDERVIMKGSVKWRFIQSWIELCSISSRIWIKKDIEQGRLVWSLELKTEFVIFYFGVHVYLLLHWQTKSERACKKK